MHSIHAAAQETYEESLRDPSSSRIRIIRHSDYEAMPEIEILRVLRDRHILVTEIPHQHRAFNQATLRLLGSLETPVILHGKHRHWRGKELLKLGSDLSVPRDADQPDARHRRGTPYDILKSTGNAVPKSLNGLDFPLIVDPFLPQKFSSDLVAWAESVHRGYSKRSEQYPITSVRWGLAATAGCYHPCHVDCDGFGTFIEPETGVKLWFLASPRGAEGFDGFGSIDLFTGGYDPEGVNADRFRWELAVLKPGMRL